MPAGSNAIRGKQGFQRTARPEPDLADLGMTEPESDISAPLMDPNAQGYKESASLAAGRPGGGVVTRRSSSVRLSDGWGPDRSYPVPQCNDLDKIPAVIDAIDAGANTADGVAVALGMSTRQGGYYSAGAGWLGLAEKDTSTTPHTWSLTGVGEQMRGLDPDDRAALLAQMVDRVPEAAFSGDAGMQDDFRAEAEDGGLAEYTAERRLNTMRSWRAHAANRGSLAASMSEFTTGVDARIGDARAASTAERRAAEERAKAAEPRRGEICMSCFQEKSLSGECGCF